MEMRVGILGAADIARKNTPAMMHPESGCVVAAWASRSQTRQELEALVHQFCRPVVQVQRTDGWRVPSSWMPTSSSPTTTEAKCLLFVREGTHASDEAHPYDQLVQSDAIDAVYIPLPTSVHKEWVLKACRAKKHVLLEKPVALCTSDYLEMLETARRCGVYLQDGTMFVHHARTAAFLEAVSPPTNVMRISGDFGFCAPPEFFQSNIRVQSQGDPLGCIGDVGWYLICAGLAVYRQEPSCRPVAAQVVDSQLFGPNQDIPIDATCLVHFEGNRRLVFHCTFMHPMRQRMEVCAPPHQIWVLTDFVLPPDQGTYFECSTQSLTQYEEVTQTKTQRTVVEQDGKPQETCMWHTFGKLCHVVEEQARATPTEDKESTIEAGWNSGRGFWSCPDNEENAEWIAKANELTHLSIQTQRIADALMESIRQGGALVEL